MNNINIAENISQKEFVWRTENSQVPISLMRPEEKVGALASCLSRCNKYDSQVEELDCKIAEYEAKKEKALEDKARKKDSYDKLADIMTIMQESLEKKDDIHIPSSVTVKELNEMKDNIINSYLKDEAV